MAIPERIKPTKLDQYLEIMTKAVFQAGVSWAMIENKWPGFLEGFAGFDPKRVARFDEADIERLMTHPHVVHSRKRIEGTIENAKTILALDKKHGGFQKYLRSKATYDELRTDIRKQFKGMGDLNVYYFLFRVSEPVPKFEEWIVTIEGEHPRMREMVELARKSDPSL